MADTIETKDFNTISAEERSISIGSFKESSQRQATELKMKKRYNFLSLVSIITVSNAGWEAMVASLYQILVAGGPAAFVWGYVLSAVAGICITLSLAEFASIWPSASGQYHWAMALAPKKWKVRVGWFSSWILLMMNTLSSLSAVLAGSLTLSSLIMIGQPDYHHERWHTYMIGLCIIVTGLLVNIFIPRALHHLSVVGTVTHVLGFFAIIITLLATTKTKNSGKVVFGEITDFTGWNNNGAAFLIGLLPAANGFTALDQASRYSEETVNPRTDVSRAMFWGVMLSTLIGIPFVLVIAFCMGDPAVLITSEIASLSPLAQIVLTSTGSFAAAIILPATIVVVAVISAFDTLGGVSRLVMSQARDQGFPYSQTFLKIHPRWNTPVNALIITALVQACVSVIYVGNSTAFFGITSGVLTLMILSYSIPISLHLFRRKTLNLKYGPWTLGSWGRVISVIGLILYILLFVAVSLPSTIPVTAENMNYASPIAGITLILTVVLYFAWGRRTYRGPLFDLPGVTIDSIMETEIIEEKDI